MSQVPQDDHPRVAGGCPRREDAGPRRIPRAATAPRPDDVGPRLIGLGGSRNRAARLVAAHPHEVLLDALDALEELVAERPVRDPVGWIEAAAAERWDLSGLLADRRERERQLAAWQADHDDRARASDAYPQWRAVADRWDAAVSAALDDDHLAAALEDVTAPVPGLDRRSVPLARAELVAWAIDVHERGRDLPLGSALAADLDRGPAPAEPRAWPLPEPPEPAARRGPVEPLASRIAGLLQAPPDVAREQAPVLEVAIPRRAVRFGQDLER